MANIKSSKKDIRRIITRTERNRHIKSKLKTLYKKWQQAAANKDVEEAKASMKVYISALDKASKKNIVHRNKVNRRKSLCMKRTEQQSA